MAALGTTVLTLVDFGKSLDPNGSVATVIELLSLTNEILTDMGWVEGNLPTGHRTTVRTGLPAVAWRLLNAGVTPSKSTKSQLDEQCGKMEAWSEVDCALAKLNGNIGAFRLSEARAFLEAMNQEFASVLFYGNAGVNPEKFTGLSVRYGTIAAGTGNKQNIIDGAGTGSVNTSVWLICWGDQTVHGIYPKGSMGGLQQNDFGEQTVQTATGIGTGRMRAYQEQYVWDCGLALKDWRYVARICNIDTTNLVAESTPTNLIKSMIRLVNKIPTLALGRAAWYMNRTTFEMLDIQRLNIASLGGQFGYNVIDGINTPSFRQIPIRRSDSLLNSELRVV